ncbi:MAG: ROK family protein [Saprospiraceae bacterium]|nr:ROK family protein [Saprospiraceae bacterium]
MENDILWGIDLGGTKIEGVVVDVSGPLRILDRRRVPTEAASGYEHILDQIERLVNSLQQQTSLHPGRLGIGTPGIIDKDTQCIKNSNTLGLVGRKMKADLEHRFGMEVRMANDANCFAIAECLHGVVPERLPQPEVVFGVIMGTGVGSGVVANGKVLHGKHGIAGEWGHNVLDPTGDPCYCGKRGCVETFLSGPACEKFYASASGRSLPMPEIYARYQEGEPAARETIDRLLHYFGKAIAVVINIIDPDAVVLGGGLGHLDVLHERALEVAKPHVFNYDLKTLFLRPKLGDSAGVIGAALL